MALPVLDGNQSATTLSSVVTGGEHIVAHTVVSLGSTAISNITSAISGSVVSVSNFPATQPISGTVTANLGNIVQQDSDSSQNLIPVGHVQYDDSGNIVANLLASENWPFPTKVISGTVTVGASSVTFNSNVAKRDDGSWTNLGVETGSGYVKARVYPSDVAPFTATVTVGNTVTIGSLPTLTPQLPRVTFIDGSGSVTTANSAITVFASSTTRSYLLVQVTTGSAFVNVGATATTVNGINLTAGQGYAWETTIPQGLVSLISTTTSSRWVAKEA